MGLNYKNQESILKKLKIDQLNDMQLATQKLCREQNNVLLLSPTGTGKTLAFLLPLLEKLDSALEEIQALILVPSRELAIQIEQVIREMGSGFKTNAVYGGRSGYRDKIDLKHPPAILIGTPGRIADHIRRDNIYIDEIETLVLDEFDKSLEVGFEKEMKEIISSLISLENRILTSASQSVPVPNFVQFENPSTLNFLDQKKNNLDLKFVTSPSKDKLESLLNLLGLLDGQHGIIFCNFKDTINYVSDFLHSHKIAHGCFFGGMEQIDRERSLIKFRNGTNTILLATDLAARGIDVPELDYIIHYQLPIKGPEFTHRNGRTARMNTKGAAYLLKWKNENLPSFIEGAQEIKISEEHAVSNAKLTTLHISGGRRDKISKGDIAGHFYKNGNLPKGSLGAIELKNDCAYVAVPKENAMEIAANLNNSRIKKKKVRVTPIR